MREPAGNDALARTLTPPSPVGEGARSSAKSDGAHSPGWRLAAASLARRASIAAIVARRTSVTPVRVAVESISGLARFAPGASGGPKLRIARFRRSVCFSSVASSTASTFDSATISAFSARPSP